MRVLLLLLLLAAIPSHAQVAMPKPELTPGIARPLSKAAVCTIKWGRDTRHVSASLKKQVCAAYGTPLTGPNRCPGPAWELDHLMSRELAGADDKRNIWAQPIAEARLKDRLENRLHVEVCAGRISLAEAQHEIATDWWAA